MTKKKSGSKKSLGDCYELIIVHDKCPKCKKSNCMPCAWSDNPKVRTAICVHCEQPFEAELEVRSRKASYKRRPLHYGKFRYLGLMQVIYQFKAVVKKYGALVSERYIHDQHPDVYFSILKHLGSYEKFLCEFKKRK